MNAPHDPSKGPEGKRQSYKKGCRCPGCSKAQSDYRAELRARNNGKAGRAGLHAVPDEAPGTAKVPVPPSEGVAPAPERSASVVASVQKEISGLKGAENRPGLVAAALAMARLLDNPMAITQHPAAVSRLADLLETLGKSGRKQQGRLAAVRQMTNGA